MFFSTNVLECWSSRFSLESQYNQKLKCSNVISTCISQFCGFERSNRFQMCLILISQSHWYERLTGSRKRSRQGLDSLTTIVMNIVTITALSAPKTSHYQILWPTQNPIIGASYARLLNLVHVKIFKTITAFVYGKPTVVYSHRFRVTYFFKN